MSKKRKRKGAKTSALEAAAKRAATPARAGKIFQLPGEARAQRRRQHLELKRRQDRGWTETTARGAKHPETLPHHSPRQRRLLTEQREATRRALAHMGGKPAGPKARRAMRGELSQELRDAICGDRKRRREAMFAGGSAGKGKKKAARKPRQRTIWSDVRC